MRNAVNIIFVRHGETLDNIKRLVQGHRNSQLSETGRLQAQFLGQRLEDENFTRIYSSDLSRAFDTTEILLKHSKTTPPRIISDKRLRERGLGEAEGLHYSVVIDEAKRLGIAPRDVLPPGAESLDDVRERVVEFVQILFDLGTSPVEENVLVVTHGAWLQTFMTYLHSNPHLFTLVNFTVRKGLTISGNTGITRIQIQPRQPNEPQQIIFSCLHDVSHLDRISETNVFLMRNSTCTVNDGI